MKINNKCYKASVGRMKECDRCYNWFHEIRENFNCEDQISKANSEKQWFCRCFIGIHRLSYEIINIFVNFCLENEEMHSIKFGSHWTRFCGASLNTTVLILTLAIS